MLVLKLDLFPKELASAHWLDSDKDCPWTSKLKHWREVVKALPTPAAWVGIGSRNRKELCVVEIQSGRLKTEDLAAVFLFYCATSAIATSASNDQLMLGQRSEWQLMSNISGRPEWGDSIIDEVLVTRRWRALEGLVMIGKPTELLNIFLTLRMI